LSPWNIIKIETIPTPVAALIGYAPWVKQYGDTATSWNISKLYSLPITTEG